MSNSLLDAARIGDTEGLKSILMDAYTETGPIELNYGLFKAVKNGHNDCVELLLNAEADPNIEDSDDCSNTPLVLAAMYGHVGVAKQLLDAGASVNKTNMNGQTALCYAVSRGHFDLVKLLLDAGIRTDIEPDEDDLPLPMAVDRDNYAVTELLLYYGAHVIPSDKNLQTALYYASTNGNVEMVKLLLNYGAQIDSTSLEGAYLENHTHLARFLEEQCGDLNMVRDSMGRALCEATFMEYTSAVESLLKAGANPNFVDTDGPTPVLNATIECNSDSVKLLIRYGCNVDIEGKTYLDGETDANTRLSTVSPIYAAVWNKNVKLSSMIYMASMKTQKQIISILSCNYLEKEIKDHKGINNWLKDTFSNPPSLLHLCRQNIRASILPQQAWGLSPLSQTVSKLSIPQVLEEYLVMQM